MNFKYSGLLKSSHFALTNYKVKNSKKLYKAYYKIIWAQHDDVVIYLDGYSVNLKKDQVLFTTPFNDLTVVSENHDVICFLFTQEFYCLRDADFNTSCNGPMFLGTSAPVMINLDGSGQRNMKYIVRHMKNEFLMKKHMQGVMLYLLLKQIVILCFRLSHETQTNNNSTVKYNNSISEFMVLLEMHYKEYRQVSNYAKLLDKTPNSLSNQFKSNGLDSPSKVISNRIVLEAKRQLMYSDKILSEISEDLGFNDVSHFSKYFKKHTGDSPSIFREKVDV